MVNTLYKDILALQLNYLLIISSHHSTDILMLQSHQYPNFPSVLMRTPHDLQIIVHQTSLESQMQTASVLNEANCSIAAAMATCMSAFGSSVRDSSTAAKWACLCSIPFSEQSITPQASPTFENVEEWESKKVVELSWGTRGEGDVIAYWADFHEGVSRGIYLCNLTAGSSSTIEREDWDLVVERFDQKVQLDKREMIFRNVRDSDTLRLLLTSISYPAASCGQ